MKIADDITNELSFFLKCSTLNVVTNNANGTCIYLLRNGGKRMDLIINNNWLLSFYNRNIHFIVLWSFGTRYNDEHTTSPH